ncbi:MAG TPA: hypothetical protein DCR55_10630 [Lentisphaeria bacterium]|nr:hypothetical protein [Lentisphaeria bacterium]
MRVVTVLNPLSCSGAAQKMWDRLAAHLDSLGIVCQTVSLLDEQLCPKLCEALSKSSDAIIGVGGDGTHMSVINVLLKLPAEISLPPYLPAPCGTGNDLAKSLGIQPQDLKRTAELLTEGTPIIIDLGLVRGRWFADAVSLGIEASILARRDVLVKERPNGHGYWPYFLATLDTLGQRVSWHIDLTLDGSPWYSGPVKGVVINNAPIHASEFVVTPGASMSDGWLDIAVFPVMQNLVEGYMRRCRRVPRMLRSRRPKQVARAKRIELNAMQSVPWQMDGETQDPECHLNIGIDPSRISVLSDSRRMPKEKV